MATPHLDREIRASLEDLECGRGFSTAFPPRRRQIMERTLRESGWKDGLLRWEPLRGTAGERPAPGLWTLGGG
ncbi:hypothetical protein [Streptosporangium sp. NPDC049376]|uniref:hypothetical protein n=1 Tax=Streptosporangium sp. NPDC049376 TaxID=3366192 RepID=UPI0037AA968B